MVRFVLCVVAGLGLVVCSSDIYGEAVPYRSDAKAPIEVTIPPNAQYLSQQFYHPKRDSGSFHNGLDVKRQLGDPVIAAAPGVVVASYYEPAYGNRIRIDHGVNADGAHVYTKYYHLDQRLVAVGDVVDRGAQIGTMGATGAFGLANHLHFETHIHAPGRRSLPVDPNLMWVDGVGQVTCYEAARGYRGLATKMTYPTPCR